MLGCGAVHVRSPSAVPNDLPAGALVLRVEVIESTFTGFSPVSDCPEGKQCLEFYGWKRYRARVNEVISGDWIEGEVTFARLEHASYIDKVTRDCYVILHPASPDIQSKIGVPFVAKKLLSNFIESHRAEIKALRKSR
jgi:hypothetical protein